MALTELKIRSATCPNGQTRRKLSDKEGVRGLQMHISSAGRKTWYFSFTFAQKREILPLGSYPTVSLKEARFNAKEARSLIVQGINPMEKLREKRRPKDEERTFEAICLRWWELKKTGWSKEHAKKIKFVWLGRDCKQILKKTIDEIDEGDLVEIMQQIDKKGLGKSCSPILSVINRVFGYALGQRLIRRNPAQGFPLSDVIKPLAVVKNRAAIITSKELGQLMRDIQDALAKSRKHNFQGVSKLFGWT